jgi:hypothetical protein
MDEDGLDSVDDEALLYVTANRVGVFRKGRSKAKVVSGAVCVSSGDCSEVSSGQVAAWGGRPRDQVGVLMKGSSKCKVGCVS